MKLTFDQKPWKARKAKFATHELLTRDARLILMILILILLLPNRAPPPYNLKNEFFEKICIRSCLLIGQTPLYLVLLESSLKMQDNGVCFILEYTVCICSNLTESQRAPPPLRKILDPPLTWSHLPRTRRRFDSILGSLKVGEVGVVMNRASDQDQCNNPMLIVIISVCIRLFTSFLEGPARK